MGIEQVRFKNDPEIQQFLSNEDVLKAYNYNRSAVIKAAIKFFAVNGPHKQDKDQAQAVYPIVQGVLRK